MPVSPMTWDDLEKVVADSVYAHFASLEQPDREKFCRDVKNARRDMLRSYNKPGGGEAYALWYHMLRANEVCIALDVAKMFSPLEDHRGDFQLQTLVAERERASWR